MTHPRGPAGRETSECFAEGWKSKLQMCVQKFGESFLEFKLLFLSYSFIYSSVDTMPALLLIVLLLAVDLLSFFKCIKRHRVYNNYAAEYSLGLIW